MDKVLKIGIIGCGAIGKDHCRRIIETVPGATVVAVSDYVAAAADDTAAKYGIRSYGNDCDGMIKDPEVEAVVITSIDPTHHDYVMKTLAEEKWCFCEKPLSQNAKDCEEIINRELEIGKRLVQVGFMRHYDRGYAEMKRIIDSGEIGKPLLIKACHRNVSQGPGFASPTWPSTSWTSAAGCWTTSMRTSSASRSASPPTPTRATTIPRSC